MLLLSSSDLPPLPLLTPPNLPKMPSNEPPPPPAESPAAPPSESPSPAANDGSSSPEQWRPSTRSGRFPRACTARTAARLRPAPPSPAPAEPPRLSRQEREERAAAARAVTQLAPPVPPGQEPRWALRSMWQLASLLHFLHVFRPLLNINLEFSAEELETALVTPNSTLDDVHMPLLKAIPPITRMALGRTTWVTVLCRKLKDWWHWVADGDIPIVASQGAEAEIYKTLEPGTRVLILKALCDIRVEQEDIRSYIENSLKHGIQLSAFRRERIGGDSHGISYW
ncbi:DDT domain-containing protein DDR4 [Iris pallida]|uniref:DDT domain-containing protein DDR4 n=1 Tax=Iris pallida TaxID=29817 RepID=A0AAX6GNQ3_IRIPA|nr:DDT domain-containing protein DDR4 [Iris pallida]